MKRYIISFSDEINIGLENLRLFISVMLWVFMGFCCYKDRYFFFIWDKMYWIFLVNDNYDDGYMLILYIIIDFL